MTSATGSEGGRPTTVLSPALADHYARHGVEGVDEFLSSEAAEGIRFIRLNPRYPDALSIVRSELPPESRFPLAVPWLNEKLGFYAMPANFPLARSESYRSGRIYGMDVSSGAAVAALLFDDHDVRDDDGEDGPNEGASVPSIASAAAEGSGPIRVLDLCCSPGLKLCAIADSLRELTGSTVVGVDVSESRISLCRKIVTKYHGPGCAAADNNNNSAAVENSQQGTPLHAPGVRIRLYRSDGTTFGIAPSSELVFDSSVANEDAQTAGKRKRMNKSARARERKRLRSVAHLDFEAGPTEDKVPADVKGDSSVTPVLIRLFDRVLVDAECSTDGAVRHMKQKRNNQERRENRDQTESEHTTSTDNSKLNDAEQLSALVDLQRRLILSGFRLLKPGGISSMVYSTCSLSTDQNESVVSWLLEQHQDSFIIPVSFQNCSDHEGIMVTEGSIRGTVRFRPNLASAVDKGADTNRLFGGGFFLAKIGKR